MATVDKNFKVKHGLVVEGNTATVNGEDILTTGSTISTTDLTEGTNLFFTEQRAQDAVAVGIANAVTTAIDALTTDDIEEGEDNLYFTAQRAIDAVGGSATSENTPDTVVKRNSNGSFDATNITLSGGIAATSLNVPGMTDSLYIQAGGDGGQMFIRAEDAVNITSFAGDIILNADGTSYLGSAASGNEIATAGWVNTQGFLYSNALTGYATESYVGNQGFLVANDITGKQDTLYAGPGVAIGGTSGNSIYANVDDSTITATGGPGLDALEVNYGSGLTVNSTGLIVDTDVIATKTYTDNAISTAVDGLVDGAPGLLDTLNELAAAINDDENYATTMTTALAGKQATLTAGAAISSSDLANNIVSVVYGNTLTRTGNSLGVRYGTGLSANSEGLVVDDMVIATRTYVDYELGTKQNALTAGDGIDITANTISIELAPQSGLQLQGNGGLAVDVESIATVDYVSTNFVNVADLPGQLDDYVLLSEKGSFDGVATLDGTGNVPVEQLGNVPDSFITALGNTETNLSVTGLDELVLTTTPAFTSVDINEVAKQFAATATATANTSTTVYSWNVQNTVFQAAEVLVRVKETNGTGTELSKVLIAVDSTNNIHMTEYGMVSTSGTSLADISANINVGNGNLTVSVTPVSDSSVFVTGTLLA